MRNNNINTENIKEVLGDKAEKTLCMDYWIEQYNLFNKAKCIGIKFSPHDLTTEQVDMFYLIDKTLDEQDTKNNENKNENVNGDK